LCCIGVYNALAQHTLKTDKKGQSANCPGENGLRKFFE